MAAPRKASAKKTAPKSAPRAGSRAGSKSAVQPLSTSSGPRGTQTRPEADAEASPTYRADMGEGLPPQKDNLNANRAK